MSVTKISFRNTQDVLFPITAAGKSKKNPAKAAAKYGNDTYRQ